MVSYLAKVSEDSGSVRLEPGGHVTPLYMRRGESEVDSAHEPQGCLARTASHRGLTGGAILGEMCEIGSEAYLISTNRVAQVGRG
jgi:hypothetical protein